MNYCGKYYGTPKSEVDARLDRGTTVVLVIEVVGAANIKSFIRKARSFSSCRPVWTSCAPACAAAGQRAKRRLPAGSSGQRKNCPMPESMIFGGEPRCGRMRGRDLPYFEAAPAGLALCKRNRQPEREGGVLGRMRAGGGQQRHLSF